MTEDVGLAASSEPQQAELVTAGFLRRLVGAIIDGVILAVVDCLVWLPLFRPWQHHGPPAAFFVLGVVILLFLAIGYSFWMLGCYGWTVGMRAVKVRVARPDGTPIGYAPAAVRTFAYWVPLVLAMVPQRQEAWQLAAAAVYTAYAIGALWMIVDRRHQTYYDKIAGTLVVRRAKPLRAPAPEQVERGGVRALPSRSLRAAQWAGFLLLSLIPLSIVVLGISVGLAERQKEAILAELKSEGKPTTMADLVPPPIPDAENATLVYQAALDKLKENGGDRELLDNLRKAATNWTRGLPLGHRMSPEPSPRPSVFSSPQAGEAGAPSGPVLLPAERLPKAVKPGPGEPSDAEVLASVRNALAKNREAVALARQAAMMEKCRFNLDWSDPSSVYDLTLPQFVRSRSLLQFQAMVPAEEGRGNDALRTSAAILNMPDQLLSMPLLGPPVLAFSIVTTGLSTVERILYDSDPSPALCRELEARLSRLDLRGACVEGMEGQRVVLLTYMQLLTKPNPPGTPPDDEPIPLITRASGRMPPILQLAIRWYVANDQLFYLKGMAAYLTQARVPFFEQKAHPSPEWVQLQRELKSQNVFPPRFYSVLVLPLYVYTTNGAARAEAIVGLARIALLLKVYRAERGAYPQTLDELERFTARQLPLDPCSGKPFHYRRSGQGFILYGVGTDGKDDGGMVSFKAGSESPIPPLSAEAGSDLVWVCRK